MIFNRQIQNLDIDDDRKFFKVHKFMSKTLDKYSDSNCHLKVQPYSFRLTSRLTVSNKD